MKSVKAIGVMLLKCIFVVWYILWIDAVVFSGSLTETYLKVRDPENYRGKINEYLKIK